MVRRWVTMFFLAAGTAATAHSANADPATDKAAILQRLQAWTIAFNAGDSTGVCDLFAPDLIYVVPEIARGTRETMCGNLTSILARHDLRVGYADPDVHEIILAGDVAAVRLTWTLTTEMNGEKDVSTEEGMDIFGRQPDGRWSIIRFMAFTTAPNALLGK